MLDRQPLFALRCTYADDAAPRREAALSDHVAYLRANRSRVRFAGPMLDEATAQPSGALVILEADRRRDAEDYLAGEPFQRAGVFSDTELTRFASAIGSRQPDVDVDPTSRLYLCQWTAVGGAPPPRGDETPPPTDDVPVRIIEAGPLLDDDATRCVGGLLILEVSDRGDAEAFVDADIRRGDRVGSEIRVERWRLGRSLSASQT